MDRDDMRAPTGLLAVLSAAALAGAPAASSAPAARTAQHTLQARWDGGTVIVHVAVCGAAPGSLAVHVTEWDEVGGARTDLRRRLWRLPTDAGCHVLDRRWAPSIPAGASHTVAIRVHDGTAWNAAAVVSSGASGTSATG